MAASLAGDRSRRARWVGTVAIGLVLALAAGPTVGPPAASADDTTACPSHLLPATDLQDATGTHGEAVRCLAWYGLTEGRTADTFGIRDGVTRGQMASLLVRLLEAAGAQLPTPDQPPFDDAVGTTHQDTIERLAAVDILRGTAPGTVEPNVEVTREQFAALVVRSVEWLEEQPLPPDGHAFDDVAGEHEEAVAAAATAGFVQGVSADRFDPRRTLTRGEGATVLARVLERFVGDDRLERPAEPTFRWESTTLDADLRAEMTGVSWEAGCPVHLDDLRLVVLTHRGFDGQLHRGELVVHRTVVDDLETVFAAMYDADVPLERVERIEEYDGSDDASMAANNTHAFNCRRITGGSSWSQHAGGTAIDLNPIQNPYVRGGTVLPPDGEAYLDRSDVREGMFVEDDVVVDAFDAIRWTWGGRWSSLKDYQHFERPSSAF